ncbi:Bax inhibitor-1/YccA family protein [Arthrobacter sp. VKM Ac-2550]|uniref:Bax inhibitor-1/YccA family protein n=1 Tax=Crystallibacter permensis TaxID=1938888 RepID=UPI002227E0EA|nr:Bax inhibitor-1/YccA family protein [Arthrobacter sp. VKM Ac-2550]MCW2135017.1 putative membrane protein, YccA/Bax inhibitor family [Arthrobacter sp. VKM Ac-2550]
MALKNPVLDRLPRYAGGFAPATYDSVMRKTLAAFGVAVLVAAVSWQFPILYVPGIIGGFILGLVVVFKRDVGPGLVLSYAAFEGMFLGAISAALETRWPGIAMQAVLAVFATSAVTFWLFRKKGVRVQGKVLVFLLVAMGGYLLFGLLNIALMFAGVTDTMFGLHGAAIPGTGIPWGVPIGLLAVLMASMCLILDLTEVEDAVKAGAPESAGWKLAAGLLMTIVWMYVEMLRLIALLRGED